MIRRDRGIANDVSDLAMHTRLPGRRTRQQIQRPGQGLGGRLMPRLNQREEVAHHQLVGVVRSKC